MLRRHGSRHRSKPPMSAFDNTRSCQLLNNVQACCAPGVCRCSDIRDCVPLQGFSVADFLASVQAAADKAKREGQGS